MRTRRKWWFWGMWVALPCGRVRLCGPRRPPLWPLREDGGHLLGLRVGSAWLEGPCRDLAAQWADLISGGGRGRCGAAVSALRVRLGWAPATREGMHVGVRGGEQFAWAAFGGREGSAWGFGGVCGGRMRVTGQGGCAVGLGALRGRCVWVAGCEGR